MRKNAQAYRRHRITPMHVGKSLLQPSLTPHIHWRRGSILPQPDRADVMVDVQNVENTRQVLVNYSFFFSFCFLFFINFTSRPLSRSPVKEVRFGAKVAPCLSQPTVTTHIKYIRSVYLQEAESKLVFTHIYTAMYCSPQKQVCRNEKHELIRLSMHSV